MGIGGMDMAASKIPKSELWKSNTNRVQMDKIYKYKRMEPYNKESKTLNSTIKHESAYWSYIL